MCNCPNDSGRAIRNTVLQAAHRGPDLLLPGKPRLVDEALEQQLRAPAMAMRRVDDRTHEQRPVQVGREVERTVGNDAAIGLHHARMPLVPLAAGTRVGEYFELRGGRVRIDAVLRTRTHDPRQFRYLSGIGTTKQPGLGHSSQFLLLIR